MDSTFLNEINLDTEKFFEIVYKNNLFQFSKSDFFQKIMNEIGIPKIIYSQLTTKFAIDSIKTFLIGSKSIGSKVYLIFN